MKKQKSLSITSLRGLKQNMSVYDKNLKVQIQKQKASKNQQTKPQTIKQMYEYKIKTRLANKNNQKSNKLKSNQKIQRKQKSIQSLKAKINQLQNQNSNIKKQNERLNSIIKRIDPHLKNSHYIDSDFKKQMIQKLKKKQKLNIKTQPAGQDCSNMQKQIFSESLNRRMSVKQINQKIPSNKNKFTMNLNMSFVNLDFQNKNTQDLKNNSKSKPLNQTIKQIKSKAIYKDQDQHFYSKQKLNNMSQIFDYFSRSQIMTLKQLKDFEIFLNKLFSQFQNLYGKCKQIYTKILQKLDPKIYVSGRSCIESLRTRLSYRSQAQMQDYLMKATVNKICSYFKSQNHLSNIYEKQKGSLYMKEQSKNQTNIDINGLKSLQSSVYSFQIDANPQKSKPVSKYHMQKINQNLNVFMNFQNKKQQKKSSIEHKCLSTSKQQFQTYFSKPVSSNISKKISKNVSLNASLGGDK